MGRKNKNRTHLDKCLSTQSRSGGKFVNSNQNFDELIGTKNDDLLPDLIGDIDNSSFDSKEDWHDIIDDEEEECDNTLSKCLQMKKIFICSIY